MPRIAAALAALLIAVTCIGFNTVRYPVVWDMAALVEGGPRLHAPEESETAGQSIVASLSAPASKSASIAQSSRAPDPEATARGEWDPPETTAWEPSVAEPIAVYSSDPDEPSATGWGDDAPIATTDDAPADWPEPRAEWENSSDRGVDAPEDRSRSYAGEPIEAQPSARYASSPWEQTASPGAAMEEGPVAVGTDDSDPQATLVPVRPAVVTDAGLPAGEGEPPSRRSAESENPSGVADADDRQRAGQVRRLPPVDQVHTIPAAEGRPPRPSQSVPIYPTTGVL
jgi:hypothetical protein